MTLGERMRIGCPEPEMYLTDSGAAQPAVLRSWLGGPIEETLDLVLRGWGYETPAAAESGALRWRSAVTVGLAAHNVGADFGMRAPASWMNPDLLAAISPDGTPVMHDQFQLMIFPTQPAPRFAGLNAPGITVGKSEAEVRHAIQLSQAEGTQLTERQHLTYAAYTASFGLRPDARMVALVSAVELMTDPKQRDDDAQAAVDAMVATVKASNMDQSTKDSMKGALTWLRRQSIKQSVRDVAATLGDRTYMGESAPDFLSRCYDLRSSLVHGPELPDFDEVNVRGGELERIVGDLIALTIVNDTGIVPMATWVGSHPTADWDGNPDVIPMEGDAITWPAQVESD
jgi:hypothetical protein